MHSFIQNYLMLQEPDIVLYSVTILTHDTSSDKLVSKFFEKIVKKGAHDILNLEWNRRKKSLMNWKAQGIENEV